MAVAGSGFGLMALVVAVARGWVSRIAAVARLSRMLDALERATRYHGVYPHFLDGVSGATIPYDLLDDGADLVETSFLMMGLLTVRRYFDRLDEAELREPYHRAVGGGGLELACPAGPAGFDVALEPATWF